MISHSNELLDEVVNKVWHLDAQLGQIDMYSLGWKAYLHQRGVDEERRRREREVHKAKAETPQAAAPRPHRQPSASASSAASAQPTLLVIIEGPLAGSSVPLAEADISLGRAASNTVVLDDEFVSSHHARVYRDTRSGQWAIEDLNSTNGTVITQQRINRPTILPARIPVRSGATTFELR